MILPIEYGKKFRCDAERARIGTYLQSQRCHSAKQRTWLKMETSDSNLLPGKGLCTLW